MKLFKYGTIGFLTLVGALAACGSDANSGGTGSSVPCNLAAQAPCQAEVSCSQVHCSAQVTAAFGADYKSGACKDWLACLSACTCGNTACTAACDTNPGQSAQCQQAYADVGSCADQNCANSCTGAGGSAGSGAGGSSGNGAGGTSSGASCSALAACCATLSANVQAGCNAIAMAGSEANCATTAAALCGGGAGGSGAGGFSGSGAGGTTSAGAWECMQANMDCICGLVSGGTPMDTCTVPKPSCCIESTQGGGDTCICTDLTGTGLTCAQLAPSLQGSVVATCPPGG